MSRSGYEDGSDDEDGRLACYRGVIASATRGKRGQRFFRDLVAALDAMPVKRLISNDLETAEGEVCALGALGRHRQVDLDAIDVEYPEELGKAFDIAEQLARETMYENDEGNWRGPETPEERWVRVRKWAAEQIQVRPDELIDAVDLPDEDVTDEAVRP